MKRDPRLVGLSSEHHQALVLARRAGAGEVDATVVRQRFAAELAPHFAIEEEVLLPALREAGLGELCDRTIADHEALRAAVVAGDLGTFSERLTAHVRFEERELFPACESSLAAEVLERVAHAGDPPGDPGAR